MTSALFPTFSGPTVLTDNWTLTLPDTYECRSENGLLTFWRDDLAIWVNAFGTEDGTTIAERMTRDRNSAGPEATNLTESTENGIGRLSYELSETRPDGMRVNSLYTYTHTPKAQVMIAFYYQDKDVVSRARAIYETLAYTGG